MAEEHSLQVARCTKIIPLPSELARAALAVNTAGAAQGQKGADEQDKYVINIRDCSVDRNKYQIQIPLPPKIDASVTRMQVEEKPFNCAQHACTASEARNN